MRHGGIPAPARPPAIAHAGAAVFQFRDGLFHQRFGSAVQVVVYHKQNVRSSRAGRLADRAGIR
jgi:hypothetical protein